MLIAPKWVKVRISNLAGVFQLPRDNPVMTAEKCFRKVGMARVTWPLNFFRVIC